MNKSVIPVLVFVGVIALIIGIIAYTSAPKVPYTDSELDSFALCLASKNITMYGADWCSHCQAQKALFKKAWKSVPYVECPDNQKLCIEKGVTGYPTWITASGTPYVGGQSLEKLSEIANCPLVSTAR